MPAWSVPGSQRVLWPIIRCQRMVTSISVCSSMCPMWRTPVTLGGGMTREKAGRGSLLEAANTPESIHHWAQWGSKRPGSYTFSICMGSSMIAGGWEGSGGGPGWVGFGFAVGSAWVRFSEDLLGTGELVGSFGMGRVWGAGRSPREEGRTAASGGTTELRSVV